MPIATVAYSQRKYIICSLKKGDLTQIVFFHGPSLLPIALIEMVMYPTQRTKGLTITHAALHNQTLSQDLHFI